MERIQEEQEFRTSQQPNSAKNSRVNSITHKQNQSINSRSSKSPTNTSRVSFGRTDPNPKNTSERALNYIQEVPRKKKFEQDVYRTYDPIKGQDLRNKSKSPEPLSSPKAQTLQVSPTQNPSQGQAQQTS